MKHNYLKSMLVMLLMMVGMGAWAKEYTYDFSGIVSGSTTQWFSDPGLTKKAGCSTSTNAVTTATKYYYKTGEEFTFYAANAAYFSAETSTNSSYFFFGKSGSYILLPTYSGEKITKVSVEASSSHSTSVSVNIMTSDGTAASTAQTWSTTGKTHDYAINSSYQSSALRIQVTNKYNAQIKSVTITTVEDAGGSADPVDASWSVDPASVVVKASKTATATITTDYNGTLSVSSANSGIATASINGKVITVTGVAEGSTTITVTGAATSAYNAISKTIDVTVTPNVVTPDTYSITPNNAFWGTNYSGTISSVSANSLTLNGESDDISVQLKNGSSTNGYVNDVQTRVYNGYTMKFSVPTGYDITAIAFTEGSAWAGNHTASVGTMTDNKNWTGAANEVTITFKGTCQINGISVTYAEHVAPTVTYTVTFNAGTYGTCATSKLTEASAGAGVTLPEVTPDAGWDFVGWSTLATPTSANAGEAGDTYNPSEDCTLYAYYTKQLPTFTGGYIDIDLSTNKTATATDDEMTWVNGVVGVAVAKAAASVNANNYYPGTAGKSYTSTRFYGGSTLTFTPATGVTITGIEFTTTSDGYATVFANSSWTNSDAVADASNKIAYVEPTDGTQAVSATIGGTTGGTKLRIYVKASSTISVSSVGYATYYNAYKYTMPEGIEGRVVVKNGDAVKSKTVFSAGDVVPAETALLIYGTAGNHAIEATGAEATSADLTGNLLRGTLTEAETTGATGSEKYYKLANGANGLGWYYGDAETKNGSAFTIGANKCYLVVDPNMGGSVKAFFAIEGEETAIQNVETAAPKAIYDLQGRKVSAAQKGLYIINGKKVVK